MKATAKPKFEVKKSHELFTFSHAELRFCGAQDDGAGGRFNVTFHVGGSHKFILQEAPRP
jgi:hypothetical protein